MTVSRPTPMESTTVVPALNPRVQVYPSAPGTVLLIGKTLDGKWVADYRCPTEDFNERCIVAMERKVLEKERVGPRLLK